MPRRYILIVEDEPAIREVLRDTLETAGYSVKTASNGRLGLQAAHKRKPDLMLLDIIMPVMDGLEVITELRKDAWGRSIPVMVLTNTSHYQNDHLSGIDSFVKADFGLRSIVAAIEAKFKESA